MRKGVNVVEPVDKIKFKECEMIQIHVHSEFPNLEQYEAWMYGG